MFHSDKISAAAPRPIDLNVTSLMDPVLASAWKTSALYDECVQSDMSHDEALTRMLAIEPCGRKQHLVDIWFLGMDNVRAYHTAQNSNDLQNCVMVA